MKLKKHGPMHVYWFYNILRANCCLFLVEVSSKSSRNLFENIPDEIPFLKIFEKIVCMCEKRSLKGERIFMSSSFRILIFFLQLLVWLFFKEFIKISFYMEFYYGRSDAVLLIWRRTLDEISSLTIRITIK